MSFQNVQCTFSACSSIIFSGWPYNGMLKKECGMCFSYMDSRQYINAKSPNITLQYLLPQKTLTIAEIAGGMGVERWTTLLRGVRPSTLTQIKTECGSCGIHNGSQELTSTCFYSKDTMQLKERMQLDDFQQVFQNWILVVGSLCYERN